MIDQKPRKAWYQLGCRECQKPTPHGALNDGLCPDCYVETDVRIEITMPTINAGIDALRRGPQRDAQTATEVFNAMLNAMPDERKRAMFGSPAL